ncbi:hypothetical protein BAJUN_02160 [Bajunvirus bajun]|uniref:Uncharacterized protein n=1 Tax=Brevundimonas phage vB_BgoS-Bajun TaxID=2948594 RepID=A0A9E7N4P7_9CAUD|nr:hypothetical protein BAJUN_02160 [Brevundimonas phage vB_BgoS-Bajun]
MNLVPYGRRMFGEQLVMTGTIWTDERRPVHHYTLRANDGRVLMEGEVPKTKSGHRNPLHLLSAIMADFNPDLFGDDYVTCEADIKAGRK